MTGPRRGESAGAARDRPMRKILVPLVFVTVVVSVWSVANVYLAHRLVFDPAWPEPAQRALVLAIWVLAALPFLQPIFEFAVGPRRTAPLAWTGYLYMGLLLLMVTGFGATDLLFSLGGVASADLGSGDPAGGVTIARVRALAIAAAAGGAGMIALASALRAPAVLRTEVRLARFPAALDGFRIVQISDLHIGAMRDRRFARRVTERVNALAPDLIAVTGDLVDGPVKDLAPHVAPFGELKAPHGVFFVTGNHDYYSGADPWLAHVTEALGWRALRNERVAIERDGAGFDLAGVDDHRGDLFGPGHGEDVPRALAGRDPSRAVVLLAHDPSTFKKACTQGIDLQLSGHTHGGQIWPFGYLVRLVVPFIAGHFQRHGAQLLVSRGTGFWGPPMRLRAPSEISEIVLRPAAA